VNLTLVKWIHVWDTEGLWGSMWTCYYRLIKKSKSKYPGRGPILLHSLALSVLTPPSHWSGQAIVLSDYPLFSTCFFARCLLIALMMEAVSTSVTLISNYHIRRRSIKKGSHLHAWLRENQRSPASKLVLRQRVVTTWEHSIIQHAVIRYSCNDLLGYLNVSLNHMAKLVWNCIC
jgi:hypothetical protein